MKLRTLLLPIALLAACAEPPRVTSTADADHHHPETIALVAPGEAGARLAGAAVLTPPHQHPFRRVGLRLDGPAPSLRWRVRRGDTWSAPAPLDLTWSDGDLHVGRVLLDTPADALELVGGDALTAAVVEFHPDPLPRALPLARDLPVETGIGVRRDRLAPADLVVMREEWGARNPGNICNPVSAPYRASVHHTASPDSDGGDPAARLRQMQAFHIDTRGWCDIGYHFVISQSGLVFEGRRGEDRPAAHVVEQNTGNVGFSFIGNYNEAQVPEAQMAAAAGILRWVLQTHSIEPTREFIRGHQEWPGQNTECPGRNLLPRVDELIERATGGEPPPPADGPTLSVTWLDAPPDRNAQGDAAGVPDAWPGAALRAVITLTNGTDGPLRDVHLGYSLPGTARATHYVIESDAPAFDGRTWALNDADAAPENPAKDALGEAGELTLYALAAGESKRITVDLTAADYGAAPGEQRFWITRIDDRYAHPDYGARPTTNAFTDTDLRGALPLAIISPTAWTWPGAEPDREGWDPCGDNPAPFWFAHPAGRLDLATRVGSCVRSAPWTAIDADAFDQIVVRLRSSAGPHVARLWFGREGERPDRARSVRFDVPGDGAERAFVVPVAEHADWAGTIRELVITPVDAWSEVPGSEDNWVEIEAIWAQHSDGTSGGGAAEPFAVAEPVTLVPEDETPPTPRPDQGVPPTEMDAGVRPDGGAGGSGGGTGFGGGDDAGGCAASGSAPGALWLVGLLVLVRRRRLS